MMDAKEKEKIIRITIGKAIKNCRKKEYSEAIKKLEKLFPLFERYPGAKYIRSTCYKIISDCYKGQNKYKKAKIFLEKSLIIGITKKQMMDSYIGIGKLYEYIYAENEDIENLKTGWIYITRGLSMAEYSEKVWGDTPSFGSKLFKHSFKKLKTAKRNNEKFRINRKEFSAMQNYFTNYEEAWTVGTMQMVIPLMKGEKGYQKNLLREKEYGTHKKTQKMIKSVNKIQEEMIEKLEDMYKSGKFSRKKIEVL